MVAGAGARRPTADSNSELTLDEATNAEAIAAAAMTGWLHGVRP